MDMAPEVDVSPVSPESPGNSSHENGNLPTFAQDPIYINTRNVQV